MNPMNIVLFRQDENISVLPAEDSRVKHIIDIVGLKEGDTFKAGIINQSKGFAKIERILPDGSLCLGYTKEEDPEYLLPITLIIGTPRPLVCKRLLKDLASLGIARVIFINSELGEKSYLASNLWKNDEYKKHLLEGLQQGGNCVVPNIERQYSLRNVFLNLAPGPRFVLHNNSDCKPFLPALLDAREKGGRPPITLAIGSERGWTDNEISMFAGKGFARVHMGNRILRTEAAAFAAPLIVSEAYNMMG